MYFKVPLQNALWMNMKSALIVFGVCLNEASNFGHNMAIICTGVASDGPVSVVEPGRLQLLLFV
jgi:hypothetical protein